MAKAENTLHISYYQLIEQYQVLDDLAWIIELVRIYTIML